MHLPGIVSVEEPSTADAGQVRLRSTPAEAATPVRRTPDLRARRRVPATFSSTSAGSRRTPTSSDLLTEPRFELGNRGRHALSVTGREAYGIAGFQREQAVTRCGVSPAAGAVGAPPFFRSGTALRRRQRRHRDGAGRDPSASPNGTRAPPSPRPPSSVQRRGEGIVIARRPDSNSQGHARAVDDLMPKASSSSTRFTTTRGRQLSAARPGAAHLPSVTPHPRGWSDRTPGGMMHPNRATPWGGSTSSSSCSPVAAVWLAEPAHQTPQAGGPSPHMFLGSRPSRAAPAARILTTVPTSSAAP